MMDQVVRDFPSYPTNGIYLDSSTKSLQPRSSITAQNDYNLEIDYTVRKSLHKRARLTDDRYYQSKEVMANFIGTSHDKIGWIANADIGMSLAIHSLIEFIPKTKPKVISSVFEDHTIIAPLLYLYNQGKIELDLISVLEEPCIPEYIEENADKNTIAIFAHTTPVLGLYRPIAKITSAIKTMDGYSIVDFSRTVGQAKVTLQNVDFGIFDGSTDLLGPFGGGFMAVNDWIIDNVDNPFPSSGNVGKVAKNAIKQIGGIEKFELGTPNLPAIIGMSESIKYLDKLGIKKVKKHRVELMSYLINAIDELPWLKIVDPFYDQLNEDSQRSSILTLAGEGHPHDIALYLDEVFNIQVRSGLLCAHPSITELDLGNVFQISTHIYNDKKEVDTLINALNETHLVIYS